MIASMIYRQIGKHESFEGKTNRRKLERKSSFMEQICHCINFYYFKNTFKNVIKLFGNRFKKYQNPLNCTLSSMGVSVQLHG